MNSYSKEREVWNKYKSMGKKRFVVFTALLFTGCMLITAVIPYILLNYLFGIPNYSPMKIFLMLVMYTIIMVFIGLKMSDEIWERRTREFNGATDTVIEINDVELKSLISKGEKIKAVKRYRIVTGIGLKEAIRYVEFFSKQYLK